MLTPSRILTSLLRIARRRFAAFGVALGMITALAFVATLPAQNPVSEKALLAVLQRCSQCHGPSNAMAKLSLASRESMLRGGEKGPAVIPGNAEASPLYRRVAGLDSPAMPMAPVPSLTKDEVALVKAWIDQGAKLESVAAEPHPLLPALTSGLSANGYRERVITAQDRQWWAFQKPVHHPVPNVADARFRSNPIDGFIRAKLAQKGLEPAPEADRPTLIRRAYLDLLGLLPPAAEVDAFVKDPAPDAWEKLVGRLLASPHYGERWGRHWLDVVRYADSSGFEFDMNIDNAWRYRDYVIRAFNQDKPFDRFVVEQLAGDEVDHPDNDSLTATTYYRVGPRVRFREKNYPSYRYDYMDDMIRTTYQGFMGLSVNCARCHDHKFDPISRLDYYRSIAAFWGYVDYDQPLVPQPRVEAYEKLVRAVELEMTPLRQEIAHIEQPYRDAQREQQVQDALKKYPADIQAAIRTPEAQRTEGQKLLVAQVLNPSVDVDPDALVANIAADSKAKRLAKADQTFGAADKYVLRVLKLKPADEALRAALQAKIDVIAERLPEPLPVADGVRDGDYRLSPDGLGDSNIPGTGRPEYDVQCCYLPEPGKKFEVPPLHFAANGEDIRADEKTFPVEPGFLGILNLQMGTSLPSAHPPDRAGYSTSGRRRALAEAIANRENPLTARVIVNRVWGWHFGRGIVSTPGNFGKMGTLPTHPELLDWLATEFIDRGWSIKEMQRLIMTSATYRMASEFSRETALSSDPNDEYLWRFPARRLEAEIIRDVTLDAGGQLNLKAGGEPFFPAIPLSLRADQPRGIWELTKEEPSTWRRGVYAYVKRGLKYPLFEVFDEPDLNVTSEKRTISTVPTQALTLLNNEFMLIQAGYFAERIFRDAGTDPEKEVRSAYRIALSREPSQSEMRNDLAFLIKQRAWARNRGGDDTKAVRSSLTDLAHVILNLNEFMYIR
jgi:Protein of unknown function (DUF1553)/Protein of unknown function (DUF1549)/Planctomycete cytochrome C